MKLLYKILLFMLPTTSFIACDDQDNNLIYNPGQPHYATFYMDWEKFKYERGCANPAMIDLENQIDRTLSERRDINRVLIKSINKEGTVNLTGREWNMGYRNPLQDMETKYMKRTKPVQMIWNDSLKVYNAHLSLQDIDKIGVRIDDVKALKAKGIVFVEVSPDTVMMTRASH